MKKTKKNYEDYLNEIEPDQDNDVWIMGGENRYYSSGGMYGTAMRRHDNIQFEVGFSEWMI
jgi:hypothetical protein